MTTDAPFGYCLNTSTIKGQELTLAEEIDITAAAGYDGIEPWVREIDAHVDAGGTVEGLKSRAADLGLGIVNLIGFFEWAVDDAQARSAALEEARRAFDLAARIGCKMVAAPPSGVSGAAGLDLFAAAERYAAVIDLGREFGVTPVLEFWGMAKSLGRLGEALLVASECGRAEACVLADVFHMYKGGSPYEGLNLVGPKTLGVLHMNDFPADPPLSEIKDSDRVFPGDGVAPLDRILRTLHDSGYRGMLSLELFNEEYYAMPAREVAKTGLAKMQACVERALGA
jgi:sugar phosphate isomerase/epimerase